MPLLGSIRAAIDAPRDPVEVACICQHVQIAVFPEPARHETMRFEIHNAGALPISNVAIDCSTIQATAEHHIEMKNNIQLDANLPVALLPADSVHTVSCNPLGFADTDIKVAASDIELVVRFHPFVAILNMPIPLEFERRFRFVSVEEDEHIVRYERRAPVTHL